MPRCYVDAVGPNSGLHACPVTTLHTDPSLQLHHHGLMGIPFRLHTTCSPGMSVSPWVPCICIIKQSGSSARSLWHGVAEIAALCKEEPNWPYVTYWTILLLLLNMWCSHRQIQEEKEQPQSFSHCLLPLNPMQNTQCSEGWPLDSE